jgi:hypothetical protein
MIGPRGYFLSPLFKGSENGPKIAAFFGDDILSSPRVVFVEPTLDDPAFLDSQSGHQRAQGR